MGVRLQFAIVVSISVIKLVDSPTGRSRRNGPPRSIPALQVTGNAILLRSTAPGRKWPDIADGCGHIVDVRPGLRRSPAIAAASAPNGELRRGNRRSQDFKRERPRNRLHSSSGLRRPTLICPRRTLESTRRRWDAWVGRVGRRAGVTVAACSTISRSRAIASSRFLS